MAPSPPITDAPPAAPAARQLTLPLLVTAETVAPAPPPTATPTAPREVWASLSLAAQQALRRTLLHVAREVRDADHA